MTLDLDRQDLEHIHDLSWVPVPLPQAGGNPNDIAAKMLEDHWRVIFNGNGYSEEWPIEAGKRGIWRIDSGALTQNTMASLLYQAHSFASL